MKESNKEYILYEPSLLPDKENLNALQELNELFLNSNPYPPANIS